MNISLFISTYLLAVSFYILFRNYKARQWPYVEGELISEHIGTAYKPLEKFSTADHVRNNTIGAHIEYRYIVDEEEFVGNRLSFTLISGNMATKTPLKKQLQSIQKLPNGKIKVFYKPSNPRKSTLIKPELINNLAGVIALLLGLIILYIDPIKV